MTNHAGGPRLGMGEIFSEWFAMAGRHAQVVALTVAMVTVIGTLFDLLLGDRGGQVVGGIASFFIQYHFVETVLRTEGLFDTTLTGRRYGSVFGAGVLVGLGALAGVLLLILPGIYLLARWSLANPLVIGEGMKAGEALGESWRRTQAVVWPIFGAFCLLMVVVVAMAAAFGVALGLAGEARAMAPDAGAIGLIPSLFANGMGAITSIGGGLLAVALYRLLAPARQAIGGVFD